MPDKLVIIPQPIQPTTGKQTPTGKVGRGQTQKVSFDQILTEKLQPASKVKFSKHAEDRMESRGIELNREELTRLNKAVELANKKGARDSLVLVNSTALVVSVKNNTVVTVVDKNNLAGNVFTNIDSAVIA